jgi:hypothetical protein
MSAAMSNMSPEGRQLLARYADRGWFDAAGDPRLKEDRAPGHPRRAYLVLASGTLIPSLCEVQITTRCYYRAFRGARMLVASAAARRFDLLDLSIMHRSQFRRDERAHCVCVGCLPPAPRLPIRSWVAKHPFHTPPQTKDDPS